MNNNFPWVFLLIAFLAGSGCARALHQLHHGLAVVCGITAIVSLVLAWRNWR